MTSKTSVLDYLRQTNILPFYLLVGIYVVSYSPHVERPPEVTLAAILKILPIWYLAFFTYQHKAGRWEVKQTASKSKHDARNGTNGTAANGSSATMNSNSKTYRDQNKTCLQNETDSYLKLFVIGLLVSSIGDVCLVYKSLFKPGILFFGIAHVCYLLALKKQCHGGRMAWVSVPAAFCILSVLIPSLDETVMKVLVVGYAILIHSMLYFAIARYESHPCTHTMYTMVGGSLFLLSDLLIALNKWVLVTPYSEASIMFTYYAAQLLLTVGSC